MRDIAGSRLHFLPLLARRGQTARVGRRACVTFPRLAMLLIALALLFGPPTGAAAGSVVADSPIAIAAQPAVHNAFPDELTFTISANDSAPITDVVLHYTLMPENRSVNARAEFTKGTSVQATYHMRSNGNPLYLPPGKQIQYVWQLTDANGAQFSTDTASTTFADTRFQWQTVSSGNLTLSFYRGSNGDATNLLKVGRTAIDAASKLEEAQIDFPVKLFAYSSSQDFLPAAQKESKATDPGILGQALAPDTVVFVANSLRSAETEDTVRHELTHLVTAQAVQGGFSNLLPLWLNEGTSVYAQADPGDYARALQQAIASDSVVPIQVLESSRGVDVGLFYGEAYGLVKFLVETGGQQKFAQLFSTIRQGKTTDQALQAVYGYDRTGLYNAWRDSVHLSGSSATPPSRPQAGQTENQPGANPTADTGPVPSRGSNGAQPADNGTTVLLLTVAGALIVMLLAAVLAFGLVLARRTRS